MTKLGAVFIPQFPPEELKRYAQIADQSGLDELWLWEDCFLESGIASAGPVLAWTSNLTVCIGLLPVPLRNVALTAMETATLQRLFPGRVNIGVGHGVQDWMGQVGARVESPLTLLSEYLDALRALLNGEEVSTDGRYVKLDKVKLDWPPASAPMIWSGGVGPKTLKLCAQKADGIILSGGTTPRQTSGVREMTDLPIAVYIPTEIGDVAQTAARLKEFEAAGATSLVVEPKSHADPEAFLTFLAEVCRTLT